MQNKQRRAAKAKQRAKNRARARADGPAFEDVAAFAASPEFQIGSAALALREWAAARVGGYEQPAHLGRFARFRVEYQQAAVDDVALGTVQSLIAHGWTPRDIAEIARRRVSARLAELLGAVMVAETKRHDPSRVAPQWSAELDRDAPAASARDWTGRHGLDWDDARIELVDLIGAIAVLPVVEQVMPAPGSWRRLVDDATGVDERVLSKVRALLAKAESTEFEEEADALAAKAQELMTTYAIERALADRRDSVRRKPIVRRMWIDAPYVDGKAILINEVADNNRCRCILSRECGFVTLIGFATDLDAVELLSTSLLLQASRTMRASGPQRDRWGMASTRSFRQSFLVAFAHRIGERLREATTGTESRADAEHHGALLPVLADRDQAVTDLAGKLFPELTSRSVNVTNGAGWAAGRAAADLALFDIHASIERAS